MQLTINVDDKTISEAISKGIENLSAEEVGAMVRESVIAYLSNRRNLEEILFEENHYYHNGPDYNNPRKWFLEVIKECLNHEDLAPIRNEILTMTRNNRERIVVETMSGVFADMLVTNDFKSKLRDAMISRGN